jgi:hypothetical protein
VVIVCIAAAVGACRRDDAGRPSKPRAVELSEEAEPERTQPPASAQPSAAAAAGPADVPGFLLPVIAGATVERQLLPRSDSSRQLQQVVLRSAKSADELVRYYTKALEMAGFVVTPPVSSEGMVLVQAQAKQGKGEAAVVVADAPEGGGRLVNITLTQLAKP